MFIQHIITTRRAEVLFVLRFYGLVNPMGLCQAQSVYLTTRLLDRLSPLKRLTNIVHIFCQKLTTAFLESEEGREWPYKIFHDQSPRKNVADLGGGWTRNLLVSSWTCVQMSQWGRQRAEIVSMIFLFLFFFISLFFFTFFPLQILSHYLWFISIQI